MCPGCPELLPPGEVGGRLHKLGTLTITFAGLAIILHYIAFHEILYLFLENQFRTINHPTLIYRKNTSKWKMFGAPQGGNK